MSKRIALRKVLVETLSKYVKHPDNLGYKCFDELENKLLPLTEIDVKSKVKEYIIKSSEESRYSDGDTGYELNLTNRTIDVFVDGLLQVVYSLDKVGGHKANFGKPNIHPMFWNE